MIPYWAMRRSGRRDHDVENITESTAREEAQGDGVSRKADGPA